MRIELFVALLLANRDRYPTAATLAEHEAADAMCSRDQSRLMRKVRQELLRQVSTSSGLRKISEEMLPASCPLHPAHDLYADQEEHKRESSVREWKCGYCGKIFRFEYYLDRHMTCMHADKLNVSRLSDDSSSPRFSRDHDRYRPLSTERNIDVFGRSLSHIRMQHQTKVLSRSLRSWFQCAGMVSFLIY
jgi:hypothetical protein